MNTRRTPLAFDLRCQRVLAGGGVQIAAIADGETCVRYWNPHLMHGTRDAAPCGADGSWGGLTAQGAGLCERVWAASSAERWHRTGIGALAGHLITAARCRSQANNTRHAAAFKRARRIMLHNLDDFAQLCRKRGLP